MRASVVCLFFGEDQKFAAEHATELMGMGIQFVQQFGCRQDFLGSLVIAMGFKFNKSTIFKLSNFVAQGSLA